MSSTDNNDTFAYAAWSGDVEKMVTALATVRDVNMLGMVFGETLATALYFAVWNNQLEAVRWLLGREDIDVNLGTKDGFSPLHIASYVGREAIVEALITARADVNRQNRGGFTASIIASAYGHTAVMRRLIEAGARVNQANSEGRTALDYAQWNDSTTIVELLLAHRAMPGTMTTLPPLHERLLRPPRLTDTPFALSTEEALPEVLSEKDVYGRTALHYAALTGDRAAYAVLYSAMRRAGVDTEGVDGGGYTALDHLVCLSTVDNVSHHSHPPAYRALHRGHVATAYCTC
jgi:ankyrin repeat protein